MARARVLRQSRSRRLEEGDGDRWERRAAVGTGQAPACRSPAEVARARAFRCCVDRRTGRRGSTGGKTGDSDPVPTPRSPGDDCRRAGVTGVSLRSEHQCSGVSPGPTRAGRTHRADGHLLRGRGPRSGSGSCPAGPEAARSARTGFRRSVSRRAMAFRRLIPPYGARSALHSFLENRGSPDPDPQGLTGEEPPARAVPVTRRGCHFSPVMDNPRPGCRFGGSIMRPDGWKLGKHHDKSTGYPASAGADRLLS